MANRGLRWRAVSSRDRPSKANITSGGVIDSDENELTVVPYGVAPSIVVTTVTGAATLDIASRKVAESIGTDDTCGGSLRVSTSSPAIAAPGVIAIPFFQACGLVLIEPSTPCLRLTVQKPLKYSLFK